MKRFPIALLVCLFVSVLVVVSPAQPLDRVSLDVQVVYASSNKNYVDPTLRSLKKKLNALFSYTSYEIIEKKSGDAGVGQIRTFSLPGGRLMEIVPKSIGREEVELDVKIRGRRKELVSTTLSMERSAIVMVGGPRYRDGVLIILISAD